MDATSTRGSPMSNRILIVDDQPELAGMMADMLNDAGYTTRIFDNGRDAIADIKADPPDLLLLDVNMPGL
ncbi:MAG: response regulator, partial [Comamonadaceae bacterium]